jgi:hypothetical protein
MANLEYQIAVQIKIYHEQGPRAFRQQNENQSQRFNNLDVTSGIVLHSTWQS